MQRATSAKSLVLGLIALLFLACPITGSASRVACVNIGTTIELKNISIDDRAYGIMMGLFTHRSLTRFSSNGNIVGDLATSWKIDDANVWTFTLANNVKWHDGHPLTAHDVAFTYQYLLEKFPVYSNHFNLLEDVTALDEATVQIRLRQPNYRFIVNVCGIEILPKHIFENVTKPSEFFGKNAAIGCGPFVFESYERQKGILSFTANLKSSKYDTNVDKVVVHFFKNKEVLNLAVKKGIIDLPYSFPLATDPSSLRFFQKLQHISLYSMPNLGVPKALFFNTQKPPVDNPEIRRALAEAVDYRKLIDLIAGGSGQQPGKNFTPPGTPGFIDSEILVTDLVSAKKRLFSLGYKDSDGDGILEKDGQSLTLECIVNGETVENSRVAELLQKDFKKIGANFVPVYVDSNVFQSKVSRDRSYSLLLHGTIAPVFKHLNQAA